MGVGEGPNPSPGGPRPRGVPHGVAAPPLPGQWGGVPPRPAPPPTPKGRLRLCPSATVQSPPPSCPVSFTRDRAPREASRLTAVSRSPSTCPVSRARFTAQPRPTPAPGPAHLLPSPFVPPSVALAHFLPLSVCPCLRHPLCHPLGGGLLQGRDPSLVGSLMCLKGLKQTLARGRSSTNSRGRGGGWMSGARGGTQFTAQIIPAYLEVSSAFTTET